MRNSRFFGLLLLLVLLAACSTAPRLPDQSNTVKNQADDSLLLASQLLLQDKPAEAYSLFRKALHLSQRVDSGRGVVLALIGLGDVANRLGEAGAEGYYVQAEIIAGYYELENEAAQAVIRRAELRIQAREPDAALEIMVGLEDGIQSGSMEEALLLHARGTARRLQEQYSLAVELLEKAVRLAEKNHDLIAASGSLYQLASAYSLQGQYETAAEHMRQALAYDRQMENSPGIASALEALARISLKQNRNEEATIYVQRAFAVYQEMGNSEGLQRISELASEQGLQLNTNLEESVWEQMIR